MLSGKHPLLTRANATKRGALPSPATQWTPILLSCGLVLIFYSVVYSLSSCMALAVFDLSDSGPSKKSSTILSHLSMTSFEGSCPSGNTNSST